MATPASTLTSSPVTTALFIGGKERQTAEKMAIADPAKPGVVVGHAASATPQDVRDAVAAAKAAYPAWAALTPQQRAEKMMAALKGIDGANRDADAAILSQENGKIRFEAWVDSLVLEIRWKLALSHADEVDTAKVLPPVPGAIPVPDHGVVPAVGRRVASSCPSTGPLPSSVPRCRMRCWRATPSS